MIGRILARWSPLLRRPWKPLVVPKDTDVRNQIGNLGENIAARYLQSQGCRILYRNYRADGGGEVDIVCRQKKILIFCEVKTRTGNPDARPGAAVTPEKQALILRGASSWLQKLGLPDIPWRYDIVEINLIAGDPPFINWLPAAFSTDEMKKALAQRRRSRISL